MKQPHIPLGHPAREIQVRAGSKEGSRRQKETCETVFRVGDLVLCLPRGQEGGVIGSLAKLLCCHISTNHDYSAEGYRQERYIYRIQI